MGLYARFALASKGVDLGLNYYYYKKYESQYVAIEQKRGKNQD